MEWLEMWDWLAAWTIWKLTIDRLFRWKLMAWTMFFNLLAIL
jgi:hypothetical protein